MLEFKVTFNRNVKLGNDLYRKGDSATVEEDVCGELEAKGVINDDYQPLAKKPDEPKTVEEMTVPELKEYATTNKIELGDAKKRDEILEAIKLAKKDEEEPPQD